MNWEVLIPVSLSFLGTCIVGAIALYGTRNKVKIDTVVTLQNQIENLQKEMQTQKENHDKEMQVVRGELTECKIARENLTRDRLILLEQVAFGNPQTYAKKEVESLTAAKVKVEPVK